jgi:hypothetical protein
MERVCVIGEKVSVGIVSDDSFAHTRAFDRKKANESGRQHKEVNEYRGKNATPAVVDNPTSVEGMLCT